MTNRRALPARLALPAHMTLALTAVLTTAVAGCGTGPQANASPAPADAPRHAVHALGHGVWENVGGSADPLLPSIQAISRINNDIWVAGRAGSTTVVLVLNGRTRQVQHRVEVPQAGDRRVTGMSLHAGKVWLEFRDDPWMVQVDILTQAVRAPAVAAPVAAAHRARAGDPVSGVRFAAGHAFQQIGTTLFELDPRDPGTVVRSTPFSAIAPLAPGHPVTGLAGVGDRLWFDAVPAGGGPDALPALHAYDPSTKKLTVLAGAEYQGEGPLRPVAVDGGVAIASPLWTVAVVDPVRSTHREYPIPRPVGDDNRIVSLDAVGHTALVAFARDGLAAVDLNDGTVTLLPTEPRAGGPAILVGDTVWSVDIQDGPRLRLLR